MEVNHCKEPITRSGLASKSEGIDVKKKVSNSISDFDVSTLFEEENSYILENLAILD